jgi:lysyl-tRNA synthetase class I
MPKCPKCRKELATPLKKWNYVRFTVELFECACGTKFREYARNGKYNFTLKFEKGKDKGFVKV